MLDLRRFGARNQVMADHVHPTAFGQIAIAERALEVVAGDGMEVRVRPSSLVYYETTRWGRVRGDATYASRRDQSAAAVGPVARLSLRLMSAGYGGLSIGSPQPAAAPPPR